VRKPIFIAGNVRVRTSFTLWLPIRGTDTEEEKNLGFNQRRGHGFRERDETTA
jgi:hypothetical protein